MTRERHRRTSGKRLDSRPAWIDRDDAAIDAYVSRLRGRSLYDLADKLRQWRGNGIVIFENVVSHAFAAGHAELDASAIGAVAWLGCVREEGVRIRDALSTRTQETTELAPDEAIRMRRVYLHIGAHKTGTTYVQRMLSQFSEQLDHLGLRYLRAGRELLGHHALPRAAQGNGQYDALKCEIARELAETPNDVLVSSENLELLDEGQIERLLALFPAAEVRVLFMFRNWGPLLYATWQEEVKHGIATSYHAYCLNHIGAPEQSPLLNFRIPIDRWSRCVCRDQVALAHYDAMRDEGNLCACVLRWANTRHTLTFPDERLNESLDPITTEVIRALNEMAASCGYKPDLRVREGYLSTSIKQANVKGAGILAATMEPHAKPAPDFDSTRFVRQYFDAFIHDYGQMMLAGAEPKMRRSLHKPPEIVGPGYLWSAEARLALMEYWLLLMPGLRRPPQI